MKDPTNFVSESRKQEHLRERAERGFSTEDWWNFDTYIAWVIANAVKKMKEDGHTMFYFPDEPEDKWEELTNAEYDVMIEGFGGWAVGAWTMSKEDVEKADEALDAALDVFKKRFKSLWD